VDELRAAKIKAELDLERSVVSQEQNRLVLDKTINEAVREKEMEIRKMLVSGSN